MAGHSKWANIQHRKGKQDKLRAKLFSKLSKEITVAAKMGDPDPDKNPRLRLAVKEARASSMPKDVIDRLNAAARKAARSPDFTRKVEQEGLNISAGDPAELDTYVRGEEARWARVVKENGIKAD